jgi:hypothetical protein
MAVLRGDPAGALVRMVPVPVLVPPMPIPVRPALALVPSGVIRRRSIPVLVPPMPIPVRPALVLVPPRVVGAVRPVAWVLVRVHRSVRPGPVPAGTGRGGYPAGQVALAVGPAPQGRLGPRWSRSWGPNRSRGRRRRRRRAERRRAGHDGDLPGGASLRGQDHASATAIHRLGGCWQAMWRRRCGGRGPGTARGPPGALPLRRLDLDGAHRAQVGDLRVEATRDPAVERPDQQFTAGEHRRQRGRRQRRHPQGDNHRCVAARRHPRLSPAA